MNTLKVFSRSVKDIPQVTAWYLADIAESKGKQDLYTKQSPQKLKTLKEHAIIETRPSDKHPGIYEFFIRDLGSTNHSFVNKTKVKYQRLRNNDTLHIGHNEFRFVCAEKEIAANIRDSQEETKKMPETQAGEPIKPTDSGFSRRLNILN